VRFAGLDFDTHNDDLRARLQVQFAADFNDFAVSSLGIMLLDIVAFGLDTLSFYLDRRASDAYISTARTRGAVARLSRQLGYKMRAAVASSVDLDVSITTPVPFSVTIPKRFQFKGPDDLVFESSEDVTYAPSSTAVQKVPCYEGQSFTDQFFSNGTANQIFQLTKIPDDYFVVSGSVEVVVNGASWTESEFLEFEATDQFEVGYNDDPTTIRFGDATAGNIPITGATIDVRYVASRGLTGLVNSNTISDVVTKLVASFTPISLAVNNPSGSIGGDDPETMEHAKIFAPKVFKSRYVAVTREDYEALSGSYADPLFGRVAVAQAISARDATDDIALQNMLDGINSLASTAVPVVDLQTDTLNAGFDTVLARTATMLTNFNAIVSRTSTILASDIPAVINSGRATKNSSGEITADAASIAALVATGTAAIAGIPVGADQLTVPTKALLTGYFTSIDVERLSIDTLATAITAATTTVLAQVGVVQDKVEEIGGDLVTPDTYMTLSEADRVAIVGQIGTAAPLTGLYLAVSVIDGVVEDTSVQTLELTEDVFNHVDAFLASDCQANLVVVPILAKNSSGFYAAPSLGLIKSLQSFLDARKEVTQTVAVTSGALALVPAIITIEIGVLQNFSQSVTETSAAAAMDGLLKRRYFGVSLYRSDIHKTILAVVGVSYVNVTIEGYQDGLTTNVTLNDAEGNLVIDSSKVITKGTVNISSVALTGIITS
jgi:hypothetical protein